MNAPITDGGTIRVDYEFAHARAKVWRALTDPALIAKWLMENDFHAVVGHRFTFKAPPMPGWDGTIQCEVLEADAPKRLRYSWRGGPENQRLDTIVSFTLTETASGGTRLTLEHAGFLPEHGFAFAGLSKGWNGKVGERLVEVLDSLE